MVAIDVSPVSLEMPYVHGPPIDLPLFRTSPKSSKIIANSICAYILSMLWKMLVTLESMAHFRSSYGQWGVQHLTIHKHFGAAKTSPVFHSDSRAENHSSRDWGWAGDDWDQKIWVIFRWDGPDSTDSLWIFLGLSLFSYKISVKGCLMYRAGPVGHLGWFFSPFSVGWFQTIEWKMIVSPNSQ